MDHFIVGGIDSILIEGTITFVKEGGDGFADDRHYKLTMARTLKR